MQFVSVSGLMVNKWITNCVRVYAGNCVGPKLGLLHPLHVCLLHLMTDHLSESAVITCMQPLCA